MNRPASRWRRRAEPLALRPSPPPGARRVPRIFARDASDTLEIIGLRRSFWRDFYHRALRLSWSRFVALVLGTILLENALFAALYLIDPGGISDLPPGSFSDAFFFSVQTLATIGYGKWAPVSFYANTVMTAETLAGAATLALFTGLTFARFARPSANIVFSRNAVVTTFDGRPTLMFRLANERLNQILQAETTVSLLRSETTAEGHFFRRLHDLKLVRARSPVFGLSFQVMHVLDESSPLHGCTPETLARDAAELVVVVSGLDDTMAQTVHARHSYDAAEILFGRRLADLFGFTDQGLRAMDYRRFHETMPE